MSDNIEERTAVSGSEFKTSWPSDDWNHRSVGVSAISPGTSYSRLTDPRQPSCQIDRPGIASALNLSNSNRTVHLVSPHPSPHPPILTMRSSRDFVSDQGGFIILGVVEVRFRTNAVCSDVQRVDHPPPPTHTHLCPTLLSFSNYTSILFLFILFIFIQIYI